ncbi:hypothetical protein DL991_29160 [Amycolatopsis sp. WAC 01375]|uniref:hypothetical protein n=1 Tax=Amycolatopsis sp. WAC 01375 TaxID=2203194 RepID=UPI000F79993E|nr:hypothetical protein [Amycolatopsis sp. WAC 01375]RSM74727.1 hypothetical protein DL991_29160 [Amycolatopsis sp. WAC 01375]
MSKFDKLVADAATFLGWEPQTDYFLEGVVTRIQDLHKEDHLSAATIARMLDMYDPTSPFRRTDFIQFVIDRT